MDSVEAFGCLWQLQVAATAPVACRVINVDCIKYAYRCIFETAATRHDARMVSDAYAALELQPNLRIVHLHMSQIQCSNAIVCGTYRLLHGNGDGSPHGFSGAIAAAAGAAARRGGATGGGGAAAGARAGLKTAAKPTPTPNRRSWLQPEGAYQHVVRQEALEGQSRCRTYHSAAAVACHSPCCAHVQLSSRAHQAWLQLCGGFRYACHLRTLSGSQKAAAPETVWIG